MFMLNSLIVCFGLKEDSAETQGGDVFDLIQVVWSPSENDATRIFVIILHRDTVQMLLGGSQFAQRPCQRVRLSRRVLN
jgi:hypothetical protein